jgi:hypothetical protein
LYSREFSKNVEFIVSVSIWSRLFVAGSCEHPERKAIKSAMLKIKTLFTSVYSFGKLVDSLLGFERFVLLKAIRGGSLAGRKNGFVKPL